MRPEVFQLRVHHLLESYAERIELYSDVYRLRWAMDITHRWAVECDPRRLCDFIERLVGGTLQNFYDCGVRDCAIVESIMPQFEREIHHFMERMEYESRRMHGHRNDMIDAMRYATLNGRWGEWGVPQAGQKASQKARALLMRNLDAGQLKSFKADQSFRVTGKDGKAYQIKHARSFNVVGPDGTKYCGQLTDTPIEDQMLAQKLLLEHDPDKFFKNANVSPAIGIDSRREVMWRYMTTAANNLR